ncbi:MAG: hypothetical protein R2769_16735 [Saprospiraceae bacterium]
MKLNKLWLLFPVFLMCSQAVFSQVKSGKLVQFSGIVLDGTTSELLPVPYVNISVKEKKKQRYLFRLQWFLFNSGRKSEI